MTNEQKNLLVQAAESLKAAKLLHKAHHYGYAASRAYYSMFYIAEAFLLGNGLSFSKHTAVHSAFGEHFAKQDTVPREFHRYLIQALEIRQAGDYGSIMEVTEKVSAEQLSRAELFIELAQKLIGAIPPLPE